MRRASLLILPLLLPACSGAEFGEHPGDGGGTLYAIRVEPASAALTLQHGKVAKQRFRAFAFYGSGAVAGDARAPASGGVEVTGKVTWRVGNPLVGRFVGPELRTEVLSGGKAVAAGQGGVSTVTAALGGVTGQATVKVKLLRRFYAGGAAAGAEKKFGGPAAPKRAPKLLYPGDGVLVPPNMRQLDVQWTKESGNDLFEVAFTGELCDVRVYTRQRSYNLSGKAWQAVAWSSRESEVKVRVRGTSGAKAGAGVGTSAAATLKVGKMDVKGGLYFWVVGPKAGSIHRYDFSRANAKTEVFFGPKQGKGCVGCHSLSRDGTRIAFTSEGGLGPASVYDVATRKPILDGKFKASVYTFSPDGKQVAYTYLGNIFRREVSSGKQLGQAVWAAAPTTHPDWSPDGKTLVFTLATMAGFDNDLHLKGGSIATATLKADGDWSKPKVIVKGAQGVNNYYPSFSPGGQWILFNRSSGDSYADEDANLFVVPVAGGKPIALGKINGAKQSNSWGRWSPFTQVYKGSVLYWLTFSSVRDYGYKLKNAGVTPYEAKAPQIWMAAFSRDRALKGLDPSYSPFWLPVQDVTKHNHIAQWTTKVVDLK